LGWPFNYWGLGIIYLGPKKFLLVKGGPGGVGGLKVPGVKTFGFPRVWALIGL